MFFCIFGTMRTWHLHGADDECPSVCVGLQCLSLSSERWVKKEPRVLSTHSEGVLPYCTATPGFNDDKY